MTFISLEFLIFFPIVLLLFFGCPFRYRWLVLLIASYVFYMAWNAIYILLIILTTLATFWFAIGCATSPPHRKRKVFFLLGVASNIGPLVYFKYLNFLAATVGQLPHYIGIAWQAPHLQLILPLAISFHSFQLTAYMIDVYTGKIPHERDLRVFALYACFFPQLVAGPIERGAHFLPQLRRLYNPAHAEAFKLSYERFAAGARLMLWGYFKKVLVADNLAVPVDLVFAAPLTHGSWTLLAAVFFFAIQIYFDFSAYTDIARGTARIMGFDLLENFNSPYFARSIADFWRSWHMSLTRWFRDYLYVPLGGNQVSTWKWTRNIAAVFLLSGLWHGAAWTFIAWGALHAIFYLVEHFTRPMRDSILRLSLFDRLGLLVRGLQWAVTFAGVTFAWIFFRAASMNDALVIATKIFTPHNVAVAVALKEVHFDMFQAAALMGMIAVFAGELIYRKGFRVEALPTPARWAGYYSLLLACVFFGRWGNSPFIYFQF